MGDGCVLGGVACGEHMLGLLVYIHEDKGAFTLASLRSSTD